LTGDLAGAILSAGEILAQWYGELTSIVRRRTMQA
jgi:hypothetical protein